MEVTRKNFESVIQTLSDVFNRATFLSLDTEFTGLRIDGAAGYNYFGTLEDLYLSDRLKAETFMAVQIGIVAFFYNKETKKFSHQGYNFYVYPSTYSNVNFTCQSKSIEFLVQNGFDFNKVFESGIPYLKDSEMDKLIEKLDEKFERSQSFDNYSNSEISSEHSSLVNAVMSNIENIIQNKTKSSFTTERFTSFVRRIMYSEVRKKYGNKVFMDTNKDETMSVYVGFSEQEIKEKKKENYLKEKNKILDESGFCKVIKLMMESKKLILGHNILIDLMYVIRQFLTPLPETYAEFKELTHFLFPKLLDTKYVAGGIEFKSLKDTSLPSVIDYFENLNLLPNVEVARNECGYDINEKKHHEAAYDAYLTGLAFLAMCEVLGISFENMTESSILKSKLNKLSVPRMQDITYMNVEGPDIEPDRKGVYHLTFPKDWKKENITELFQNYGFMSVSWINSTSAFIKIKYESVADLERNFLNSKSNAEYKLSTYYDYHRQIHNRNDNSANSKSPYKVTENNKSEPKPTDAFCDSSGIVESQSSTKKRHIEDIGEVIQRPTKKQTV